MRSVLLVQFLSLLLSATLITEVVVHVFHQEVVSLEIDTDNEEEGKEDKSKEYTYYTSLIQKSELVISQKNICYLLLSWSYPAIDNLTPPPESI